MTIDSKKYTRAELAKMVEDTEEMRRSQRNEYHELAEQLKSEKEKWIALHSDLVAKNQLIHALEAKNALITEQISQMNGEAVNKANEIAKLKADVEDCLMQLKNANDTSEAVSKELQRVNSENDDLRTKLADAEAALGRANALCAQFRSNLTIESEICYNATQRAAYAEAHPWRNLWVWLKRKLGGA